METWVPSENGTYVVQVKPSSKLDVIALSQSSITGLDASVNQVRYFNVTKRPVELTVIFAKPTDAGQRSYDVCELL